MILRTEDCLEVGFCVRGQMRFCRQHNIDFRQFKTDGIRIEDMAGIEDANLKRAIDKALVRQKEVL